MARKVFVGIRLDPELKESLEEIGDAEERSVSQVCEFLLRKGIDAYKKGGAKYLRKSATREKHEGSPK
jgi:predicted transcriptional regulator